jgi:regulatory protein
VNLLKPDSSIPLVEKSARSKVSLLGRAINYLSIREYSESELRKKLSTSAESEDEIEFVIQKLKDKGFLSDHRFLESFVARKSKKYGARKIAQELQPHHLDPELVAQELKKLRIVEPKVAYELWEKIWATWQQSLKRWRNKYDFWQAKGFHKT